MKMATRIYACLYLVGALYHKINKIYNNIFICNFNIYIFILKKLTINIHVLILTYINVIIVNECCK